MYYFPQSHVISCDVTEVISRVHENIKYAYGHFFLFLTPIFIISSRVSLLLFYRAFSSHFVCGLHIWVKKGTASNEAMSYGILLGEISTYTHSLEAFSVLSVWVYEVILILWTINAFTYCREWKQHELDFLNVGQYEGRSNCSYQLLCKLR